MKQKHTLTHQRGAALIILVFFFMAISLAIIQSATIGAISELRTYRSLSDSKFAYIAAEAGIEDIFYRTVVGKNMPAGNSETITLNGATSVITINSISATEKQVFATGNANNKIRKIYLDVARDVSSQFFYGAQVGAGGIEIKQNADITGIAPAKGDVYSNGRMIGAAGVFISGNAISASDVSADAYASSSPSTANCSSPDVEEVVGKGSPDANKIDFAQSFQISSGSSQPLYKLSLFLKRTNPASSAANIQITADNGGKPAPTALAVQSLDYTTVATSYGWVDVIFSAPTTLSPATTYWIVLDATQSASKHWYWCRGAGSTYSEGSALYKLDWTSGLAGTALAGDLGFRLYLGGGISQIKNIEVFGLAKANIIDNSHIHGDGYYQGLLGSTIIDGISYGGSPTPPPVALPISTTTIARWKSDAASGGTISGNCGTGGVAGCNSSPLIVLGPKKIVGDLNVGSGDKLRISGTIYVTGNIVIGAGGGVSSVECDSSYGVKSCALISDGYINVSGGSTFDGSGTAGSFVLALSTKTGCLGVGSPSCATNGSAIGIQNNVDGALFYTTDSLIDISNNAIVTAIVGYMIQMQNGTHIMYDASVANLNIVPTPAPTTGSWTSSRWNEF